LDEKPIFPRKPINCETLPDLISSNRYRAINVAAISTRNLSALVTRSRDFAFPAWLTSPVTD
jgi:hypothetical protein